jgi:thiamine biosynthesis lipoprotein
VISGAAQDRVFAFETRSMGSALRLHVRGLGPGPGEPDDPAVVAQGAWSAVLAEFDAVDRSLSRFRADSELTALNRQAGTGTVVGVSHRLRTALATVHRAARMTDGRFDARVLGALEHLGERGAPLSPVTGPVNGAGAPSSMAAPPDAARRLVIAPAEPLDMGGIGKGLALRWAAGAALSELPASAGLLLEAGGDIVVAGAPPADGWMVGIEDPAAEPGPEPVPLAIVAVHGGALATSSVRVRRWVSPDGRAVHHIVDPRTGEPARTGLIAVTVAAADPAWAEVWSKALFLAGRSAVGEEARARDVAAWWVDDWGGVGMTPAARTSSAWVAEDRLGGRSRERDGAD